MVTSVATAAFVLIATTAEGSYFATAWPIVGAVLVAVAVALVLLGGVVSRWTLVAGGAFVGFGALSVLSVTWGGLPDAAWTWLDQMLIVAAALAVGALAVQIGGGKARSAILAGVLGGATAEALYMLVRLSHGAPLSWVDGREVAGPVQYHNAQALAFGLAIPIALWASLRTPLAVRAAAGATFAILGSAMLVTQSRGTVLAVGVAVVVQAGITRSARLLGHAVLGAIVVGLFVLPLRRVDAALVDVAGGDPHAFRRYLAFTLIGAVVLAAVCAAPMTKRVRTTMLGLVGVVVVAGLVAAVTHTGSLGHDFRRAVNGEKTADLPAGQTRLSSLSLSGRRQIWRIALDEYADYPVLGHGSGSFTTYFTRVRTNKDLYVLQPHSLELEALAELGLPGLIVLVAAFAALAVAIVRGSAPRAVKGAAAGAVIVLLAESSIDWTFSFPALTAAAFLVAGAASQRGAVPGRSSAWIARIASGVAVAALVAFAGQYFAAHDVSVANASGTSSDRAWTLLRHARAFDPWNADALHAQGQLAENAHEYDLAARLYLRAADLSRNAWADQYARARALRSGGNVTEAKTVCATAQHLNPLEPLLEQGPCDFGG